MLKFGIRSRGEVAGKLVKTTHKKKISRPLVIDNLSTKPIKLKKNACIYINCRPGFLPLHKKNEMYSYVFD
ncbi:hypothetical protein CISIN_1g035215mg [Citrus sinensis]|uniref:Uncharacterized protein n=1 Tax=Citrus sinensis TaxID=2711 RepID=A0A067DSB9_CITSI|nr:hypothetical protein CISIN_1g035215mg [Citrus sinensis]